MKKFLALFLSGILLAATATAEWVYSPTAGGGGSSAIAYSVPGTLFASWGDSQIANGTTTANTGGVDGGYVGDGAMTWARDFSGQTIQYLPANNYAVGGSTWAACSTEVTSILAMSPLPNYVYGGWGTNDAAGSVALTTSLANAYTCMASLLNKNIQPILRLPSPRSDAGFSTATMQWITSYNKVMEDLCNGRPDAIITANATAAGFSATQLPICLDESGYPDYTSTSGGTNAGMIGSDGLHMTMGGAVYEGYQISQIINARRPQPPVNFETSPYDIYNSSSLINGSLANFSGVNVGMMQGTGGSTTGSGACTASGNVATYWQFTCNTTQTSTMAGSKENPRQDGLITGERQEVVITGAGSGAGQELYALNLINGVQGIRGSFSAGDIVVFRVRAQVKSCVGFEGMQAQIAEFGTATPQTNADNIIPSNYVAGVNCAQYPQLYHTVDLQSWPMTLQSGNTDLYAKIIIAMYGAGGANSLDALFSDARVFKITPY